MRSLQTAQDTIPDINPPERYRFPGSGLCLLQVLSLSLSLDYSLKFVYTPSSQNWNLLHGQFMRTMCAVYVPGLHIIIDFGSKHEYKESPPKLNHRLGMKTAFEPN
jgi:hypothetical protein